ncbi:hypothetical protein [Telluribacter humicola]|uniref:hypothetical protein n=1 Tax=Telluribacter humicola TaxID=1720261 RepID=UPI001A96D02F|nr:hypothetical protein [Telluribacter humicola]
MINKYLSYRYLHYFILLWGIIGSIKARADIWQPPKIKVYYSDNLKYKLIITPQIVPEKYYRWEYFKSNRHPQTKKMLRKKDKFLRNISAQDTVLTPCTGELYDVSGAESVLIWKRSMLNNPCPVHAIIANDGSSVATFDNWYSIGYGVNVFAIYNQKGDAKSTYKLEEISPFPLNDYGKSTSSLYWRKGAVFIDNERVELTFYTEKNMKKRIYNTKKLEFEK